MTLLNIPGFIERLCKLATRKVSEATGANFLQELEDWYTWLDNALVLDTLMQMATEEAEQSSTGQSLVLSICPFLIKPSELQQCFYLQSRRMRVQWPPVPFDTGCPSR